MLDGESLVRNNIRKFKGVPPGVLRIYRFSFGIFLGLFPLSSHLPLVVTLVFISPSRTTTGRLSKTAVVISRNVPREDKICLHCHDTREP